MYSYLLILFLLVCLFSTEFQSILLSYLFLDIHIYIFAWCSIRSCPYTVLTLVCLASKSLLTWILSMLFLECFINNPSGCGLSPLYLYNSTLRALIMNYSLADDFLWLLSFPLKNISSKFQHQLPTIANGLPVLMIIWK